jgi:hypothetical protein
MGMTPNFVNKGGMRRGATSSSSPVTSGTRAAASSGGPVAEFRGELSNVMSGRVSLLLLNTLVLGMVLFYVWTRNAQGGG